MNRLLAPPTRIAIVGGGFSGVLVAAQLLRYARDRVHIRLIERTPRLGRGVAYGTDASCHLLNVRAGKMSAYPDDPDHFVRWLRARPEVAPAAADPESFASRRDYGAYVEAALDEAEASAARGVVLERITGEALALRPELGRVVIRLDHGHEVCADRVVLALGHPAAVDPPLPDPAVYRSRRYIGDPWDSCALRGLAADAPVLLIGTGLTMVDLVVALDESGHTGRITAVSRHGLLPQPHATAAPYPAFLEPAYGPVAARALLRRVRDEVRAAAAEGYDWRSVVDAVRPAVQELWEHAGDDERRRFLRHLRPYWEVHRHRIAPAVAARVAELQASGRLRVVAGRLRSLTEAVDGVTARIDRRHDGRELSFTVRRVVNCTGPGCDYRRAAQPLIRTLLAEGLIRTDGLGLGLDVAHNGALLDAQGVPSPVLFTLGPPCKGCRWETTAVPEIREQAARLVAELLGGSRAVAAPGLRSAVLAGPAW